jgi:1,6-anhydro-N-acetylmuramate kinase
MALAKSGTRKRRIQVNVSLSDEAAELLRAETKRLRTKATTLAKELLEHALAERTGRGEDVMTQELEQLRAEIRALKRDHFNATLKLLQQSGMSAAEVRAWAEKRLKKPPNSGREEA